MGTKLEEGIEWKAEKRERRRTKVVEAVSEN